MATTYEEAQELRDGVTALREVITGFKDQHREIFEEYDALKDALEQQLSQFERGLRSLAFRGAKTSASFSGVEVVQTTKVTVHPHLLVKADPTIFANYPSLVKSVDVIRLLEAYPNAFISHPGLVVEVDPAEAKKLVTRGIVTKEVFDEVADIQTSTRITGLNDLRTS